MIKTYKCKCGRSMTYKKTYGVDFPQTIKCDVCEEDVKAVIGESNIVVPFHMKSTSA